MNVDEELVCKREISIKYDLSVVCGCHRLHVAAINERPLLQDYSGILFSINNDQSFINDLDVVFVLFTQCINLVVERNFFHLRKSILNNINCIFFSFSMINSYSLYKDADESYFSRKVKIFRAYNIQNSRNSLQDWLSRAKSSTLFPKKFIYSKMYSVLNDGVKSKTDKMDRVYEEFPVSFIYTDCDGHDIKVKHAATQFFYSIFKISYFTNLAYCCFKRYLADVDIVACHGILALGIRPHLGLSPSQFLNNINWDIYAKEISDFFWIIIRKNNIKVKYPAGYKNNKGKVNEPYQTSYFISEELDKKFLEINNFTKKFFKLSGLAYLNGRDPQTPLYYLQNDSQMKDFITKVPFIDVLLKNKLKDASGNFLKDENGKVRIGITRIEKFHPYSKVFNALQQAIVSHPLSKELIETHDKLIDLEFFAGVSTMDLIIPKEEKEILYKNLNEEKIKLFNKKLRKEKLASAILLYLESLFLYTLIIDLIKQDKNLAIISFDGLAFYVKNFEELSTIKFPTFERLSKKLLNRVLDLKIVLYYVEDSIDSELLI
uniref:Uncharacterized protein n=1 Tax=Euglena viridis TaxID=3040 RepID=M1EV26_EUGVI|nr:hypothetical protein I642_p067 [Euglena viridis]AEY70778.1 hypothetical protein [Euglena viridis]